MATLFKRCLVVNSSTAESPPPINTTTVCPRLQEGSRNRKVAATSMNKESSRSHSIFTLILETRERGDGTTTMRSSRFNLIDLAGSERQKVRLTGRLCAT